MLHEYASWVNANLAWIITAQCCYWLGVWAGNRQGSRRVVRRWEAAIHQWSPLPPPPNEFPGLMTMPDDWMEHGACGRN